MKDFDRLITRFSQFGGMRLVWEYARMGVLWIGVKELAKCVVKGRSFKAVYPVITEHVDKVLVDKYGDIGGVDKRYKIRDNREKGIEKRREDYIWFCWLQGINQAPEMVKVCLESQRRMFGDRVVVVDDVSYKDWVKLPDYVEEKYRKGIIPRALFSDLLRLELLIEHGGTWIDSSVLVDPTGLSERKDKREEIKDSIVGSELWRPTVEDIMESELFIFRYYRQGRIVGMSNWMIHAKVGNQLLMDLRHMLLAYWRDYNCTVEYYIFHLFFSVAARRYPEMMARMPKGNSYHSIMLGGRLGEDFDEKWWKELTEHVCFHKLNYRVEEKVKKNEKSYWNVASAQVKRE